MTLGSAADLALLRTFASHPCRAGSNPRPRVSLWVPLVSYLLVQPKNIRFPPDGMEVNPSASFCHVTIAILLYPFLNLRGKEKLPVYVSWSEA